MESKSFSESWQDYTIRDKILFGSLILPLFVSIIHLLIYFPVIGYFFYDIFWELFEPGKLFSKLDCEDGVPWWSDTPRCMTTFNYIISPNWLLLSTISIGIYGFFLFKTNEETSNLLNREVEYTSGPSVLARTTTLMLINAGAQIIIFLILFAEH